MMRREITAVDAYDPYYGRIRVGNCIICRDSVSNYRSGRFRVRQVFEDGKSIGLCHQGCFEKWNPRIGTCNSCEKAIRKRTRYRRRDGRIFCRGCFDRIEKERILRERKELEAIKRDPLPTIKKAARVAIHFVPIGREISLCYSTAKLLYSSWDNISKAYQTSDDNQMKQEISGFAREGVRTGLTEYQTDYIWEGIEDRVPGDDKYESKQLLFGIMSNVSEEEISLVENALAYL